MKPKRVTSKDVAELAGVSRTTVSFVLNNVPGVQISDETRQRVLQAAEALGYVPDAAARALASRRALIIGLVLSRNPHHIASDAFINKILEELIEVVRPHGMQLMIDIVQPDDQKEDYLKLVRAKWIDGMLISGPRMDDKALQALEEDGFPTVLMGQLPNSEFPWVDIDNCAAATTAVAHLISLNHKHIACITNAPISYSASAARLAGYRLALENAGILYDPELVRQGDFNMDSGFQQMSDLLDKKVMMTAAFVASDTVALGAKAALCARGLRIPEDIALVGFDDLPFARYTDPPLTTVRLPIPDLAHRAGEMLIQILNGDEPDQRQLVLDTELVVRGSCGSKVRKGK